MSKEKYQEAFSNYFTAKLQFDNEMYKSMELLEELVDIYPEYLELKAKATPMKPNNYRKYSSDSDAWGKCPNCNKEVCDYAGKYCPNCSQAIDWSE